MKTFALFHVLISLAGILSGFVIHLICNSHLSMSSLIWCGLLRCRRPEGPRTPGCALFAGVGDGLGRQARCDKLTRSPAQSSETAVRRGVELATFLRRGHSSHF